MKTKRKIHGKIFFIVFSVSLLLLLVTVTVGTTFAKFTGKLKQLSINGNLVMITAEDLGDPENPDRPGIEEEAPTSVYQVQPGDTLASIAEKFHITVDALAAYNDLDPAAVLSPGTVLHIPTDK